MIYVFRCDKCGEDREVVRPMAQCHLPEICDCGEQMVRDFQAEHCATRGDYNEPIISSSLTFDSADIIEHRRRFPHIDVVIDGRNAHPVLKNLSQKRAYLKARGWADVNSFS